MFVNGADAKSAQVFTLAHELAHLWLGETALSDLDTRTVESHRHEVWCNRVAAELLVPMLEFRSVFDTNRGHRDQMQALAARFRVSTQVILGRLREAGVLTWDQYMTELRLEQERVGRIVRGSGGGDYYKTKPVQVSKRFARGLISSALEGHTTYAEAHRLLGVAKASTFRRLGEELGWRDGLPLDSDVFIRAENDHHGFAVKMSRVLACDGGRGPGDDLFGEVAGVVELLGG